MDVDFHSYSAVVSERQQRCADINKSHARESHISVITCDGREYCIRRSNIPSIPDYIRVLAKLKYISLVSISLILNSDSKLACSASLTFCSTHKPSAFITNLPHLLYIPYNYYSKTFRNYYRPSASYTIILIF